MLVSYIVVLGILIVVADGRDVKETHVIFEADPKDTIVRDFKVHLALRRFGPLR